MIFKSFGPELIYYNNPLSHLQDVRARSISLTFTVLLTVLLQYLFTVSLQFYSQFLYFVSLMFNMVEGFQITYIFMAIGPQYLLLHLPSNYEASIFRR